MLKISDKIKNKEWWDSLTPLQGGALIFGTGFSILFIIYVLLQLMYHFTGLFFGILAILVLSGLVGMLVLSWIAPDK